jgi:hypothetical protein
VLEHKVQKLAATYPQVCVRVRVHPDPLMLLFLQQRGGSSLAGHMYRQKVPLQGLNCSGLICPHPQVGASFLPKQQTGGGRVVVVVGAHQLTKCINRKRCPARLATKRPELPPPAGVCCFFTAGAAGGGGRG